ncbi:MAG: hypothetical protein NTX63_00280 [Candidatus Peregrinibacteria bacterium]|nr:hypothetical protein [Candidatus Peregrinibacteria bacterium]
MNETLITITDAASLSGKSIQTIRRAIKAKKIKVKKQKTPQGFNYLIVKDTLLECYQIGERQELREIPIEKHTDETIANLDIQETIPSESVSLVDQEAIERTERSVQILDEKVNEVVLRYSHEREQVTQVMKDFKDRVLILENQVRMLQAPKKTWFQFWK